MLTISGRGGSGLSTALRAVTQAAGGRQIDTPVAPLLSHWEEQEGVQPHAPLPPDYQWVPYNVYSVPKPLPQTSYGLSQTLFTKGLSVGTGVGVGQQYRYLHNDTKIPDFDHYRRKSNKNANQPSKASRDERRVLMDIARVGTGITALIAVKKIGQALANMWAPSLATLAMGVIEVDLSAIAEGKSVTIKWNGKPVFVRHRTPDEISRERAVNHKDLRDPQADEERSVTGQWLVVMANCTHLGCVPISHQGKWGGYYCPCHGSHYDAAGRIREGPAPLNLEVPDHHIVLEENKLILGLKGPVA